MKSLCQKIKQQGFSLVEVMVVLGLMGGIALVIMNLTKQSSTLQRQSLAANDELELLNYTRNLLSKSQNCFESLKTGPSPRTPISFKKTNIDEPDSDEGVEIGIYQVAQNGDIAQRLSSDSVSPVNQYGKLKITSIKFIMNNGIGFNYPQDDSHSDTGIIRISYEKPMGDTQITKSSDINITTQLQTDASGTTTVQGCSKESETFESKDVSVVNRTSSGYVNNFDAPVDYTCPADKVICGESSYHSNGAEDRRHSFECCDMTVDSIIIQRKFCSWQGQINEYDRLLNFTCPNGTIAAGHYSTHDNGTEDRIYDFYCCEYGSPSQKVIVEECQVLPNASWANSWDAAVNFSCPSNKVKVGEISVHHNGAEDRIYRFKCCSVRVEEYK